MNVARANGSCTERAAQLINSHPPVSAIRSRGDQNAIFNPAHHNFRARRLPKKRKPSGVRRNETNLSNEYDVLLLLAGDRLYPSLPRLPSRSRWNSTVAMSFMLASRKKRNNALGLVATARLLLF